MYTAEGVRKPPLFGRFYEREVLCVGRICRVFKSQASCRERRLLSCVSALSETLHLFRACYSESVVGTYLLLECSTLACGWHNTSRMLVYDRESILHEHQYLVKCELHGTSKQFVVKNGEA